MSRGVNKVILVGHVGKDPDVRYSADGKPVANFTLATSEQWKDKTTGDKQEKTEWHRLVAFQRTAEIIGEYVKKGALLYIEGRLQTRKWQDKDGHDRYTTEIVVNDMQMLGSKQGNNGGTGQPAAAAAATPRAAPAGEKSGADFDDDIPF